VIDLDWLRERLTIERPGMVAVMAANNETGVLQLWRETLDLCRESGVAFYCDAAQWVGKMSGAGLGECDFLCGSAHKFGGPRGVGFLKVPAKGRIEPLLRGGPQEGGRRAGTENLPGILSMLAALEVRQTMLTTGEDKIRLGWRENFERALIEKLPGSVVVGADVPRLWNTVAAVMPEIGTRDHQGRWVVTLDKLGCAVSTGSACSSGREAPSPVLAAMGFTPGESARFLRFSSGWETSEAGWQELARLLEAARDLWSNGAPGEPAV
jgi:cysteine desulfurase